MGSWSASNSLLVSGLAATLALSAALPVALFNARRHSLLSQGFMQFSSVGFVLPGPVIALGFLTFALTFAGPLYGGLALLGAGTGHAGTGIIRFYS